MMLIYVTQPALVYIDDGMFYSIRSAAEQMIDKSYMNVSLKGTSITMHAEMGGIRIDNNETTIGFIHIIKEGK